MTSRRKRPDELAKHFGFGTATPSPGSRCGTCRKAAFTLDEFHQCQICQAERSRGKSGKTTEGEKR
jgi:hypothetical protein